MRCKGCHYSLQNLTEPRCPECGRAFDPNDPSTFLTGAPRRRLGWRDLLVIAVLSYITAFLFMRPALDGPYFAMLPVLERVKQIAMMAVFVWPFAFIFILVVWIVLRRTYWFIQSLADRLREH